MDLIKFVPEHLMILVVGIFIIGTFLKKTPKINDWLIPWILLVLGIIGSIALNNSLSVTSIIQGVICSGCAVLTNQLFKQTTEGISNIKQGAVSD